MFFTEVSLLLKPSKDKPDGLVSGIPLAYSSTVVHFVIEKFSLSGRDSSGEAFAKANVK